jgi:hypothetical protein
MLELTNIIMDPSFQAILQEVSLDSLKGERKVEIYETETGVFKTYKMKSLGKRSRLTTSVAFV